MKKRTYIVEAPVHGKVTYLVEAATAKEAKQMVNDNDPSIDLTCQPHTWHGKASTAKLDKAAGT